jgi:hypothetical protein
MESQTEARVGSNLYLYCFFKGPFSLSPRKGIGDANATAVLCYGDLCALVSRVPIDEYNEEALEQQMRDLEWLAPRVRRHEEIIRYAMKIHPVIPVRFGTIYASDERVLEILREGHDQFCSHFDFISDKEEWGVKVYAEEYAGRRTIESSSKLIAELDEQISAAESMGQSYLLKKKRGNAIRQQSIDFLNDLSSRLYQQILSWSVEGRRNKVLSKQATGKGGDMILNAAFLLNTKDVEDFKKRIDALAAGYSSDAFSFEISGPWPCYSFCPEFNL